MARGISKTWRMPLIMQKAGTTKAYFPLVFLKSEAMCVKGKCLFLFSRVYVYMCVCEQKSLYYSKPEEHFDYGVYQHTDQWNRLKI